MIELIQVSDIRLYSLLGEKKTQFNFHREKNDDDAYTSTEPGSHALVYFECVRITNGTNNPKNIGFVGEIVVSTD